MEEAGKQCHVSNRQTPSRPVRNYAGTHTPPQNILHLSPRLHTPL